MDSRARKRSEGLDTLHRSDAIVTEQALTGPLLGPIPGRWRTNSVHEPDAELMLCTDGLIEIRDSDRQFFGEQSLTDLLATVPANRTTVSSPPCSTTSPKFNDGPLADDATLVVVSIRRPKVWQIMILGMEMFSARISREQQWQGSKVRRETISRYGD